MHFHQKLYLVVFRSCLAGYNWTVRSNYIQFKMFENFPLAIATASYMLIKFIVYLDIVEGDHHVYQ